MLLCFSESRWLYLIATAETQIIAEKFSEFSYRESSKNPMGHPKSNNELNIGNAFGLPLEYTAQNRTKDLK